MNDFKQLIRDLIKSLRPPPNDTTSGIPSALVKEFLDENDLDVWKIYALFEDKDFLNTSFRGVDITRQEHYTELKDAYGFMYSDFYECILGYGNTYLLLKAPYSSWTNIFWRSTEVIEVKPVTITTRVYIPTNVKETK
jgi:hypothetical protein